MIAALANWQFAWPWLLLALPLPLLAARYLPAAPGQLGSALRIPFGRELRALEANAARAPRMRIAACWKIAWYRFPRSLLKKGTDRSVHCHLHV